MLNIKLIKKHSSKLEIGDKYYANEDDMSQLTITAQGPDMHAYEVAYSGVVGVSRHKDVWVYEKFTDDHRLSEDLRIAINHRILWGIWRD